MPGILLGMGFGGFIDGIVLHQLLQWHHMLSSTGDNPTTTVGGLEANTLADGLFHAATWLLSVIGLVVLWRIMRCHEVTANGRSLFGWIVAGWGIFNAVEGLVNHHILQIHHVREAAANEALWDLSFLVFGGVLIVSGVALARPRGAAGCAVAVGDP